jgi:hypothetical protein
MFMITNEMLDAVFEDSFFLNRPDLLWSLPSPLFSGLSTGTKEPEREC